MREGRARQLGWEHWATGGASCKSGCGRFFLQKNHSRASAREGDTHAPNSLVPAEPSGFKTTLIQKRWGHGVCVFEDPGEIRELSGESEQQGRTHRVCSVGHRIPWGPAVIDT
jgi:hypothetical protein